MKTKRLFLPVAVLLLLAALLPAQPLAVAFNDQPAGGLPTTNTDPSLQAFKYTVTRNMLAVGAEFWVGATTGTGTVGLFADALGGGPGTRLAMATFAAPPAWCWTGAVFSTPVPLQANQVDWLCFGVTSRFC